jgi:hypothetical protein
LAFVDHFSEEVKLDEAFTDERSLGVSVVNSEGSFGELSTGEVRRLNDIKLVVVEELSNNRAKHAVENILAHKIHGVFNNHDSELNELVHHKADNCVVVVEVRVAKLDVHTINNWVQKAFWLESEIAVEVEVKVLEFKLHFAEVRQDPRV